jgi:hypothetical protein
LNTLSVRAKKKKQIAAKTRWVANLNSGATSVIEQPHVHQVDTKLGLKAFKLECFG